MRVFGLDEHNYIAPNRLLAGKKLDISKGKPGPIGELVDEDEVAFLDGGVH